MSNSSDIIKLLLVKDALNRKYTLSGISKKITFILKLGDIHYARQDIVCNEGGKLVMYDNQTREQERSGLLNTVFLNGEITKLTTLEKVRAKIKSQL